MWFHFSDMMAISGGRRSCVSRGVSHCRKSAIVSIDFHFHFHFFKCSYSDPLVILCSRTVPLSPRCSMCLPAGLEGQRLIERQRRYSEEGDGGEDFDDGAPRPIIALCAKCKKVV